MVERVLTSDIIVRIETKIKIKDMDLQQIYLIFNYLINIDLKRGWQLFLRIKESKEKNKCFSYPHMHIF